MIKKLSLTLNSNDYRVVASREAEQRLYAYYGLEIKDYYIKLKNADVKIRVTEVGKGAPIVLVPGNTGDAFPLIPLIAKLRGKRIIAINRPGGGLSEGMNHRNVDFRKLAIETIETVMDFFKIDISPLMGH